MDLTTAVNNVEILLQNQDINFDDASDAIELAIASAVDKFNHDKGNGLVVDLAGNGTQIVDFPATFTYDFSVISQVEYPVDDTSAEKTFLSKDTDYTLYRKPNGTIQMLLTDATPESASDPVRVTYTKYFADITEVSDAYIYAVLQLSAYYACLGETQKASNTTADGEGLDFVDFTTTSQRYSDTAEKFLMNYKNVVFGDKDASENLGATVAFSDQEQWSTVNRFNTPRIFHPDRD